MCSSIWIFLESDSKSSSSVIDNAACIIRAPLSTSSSTKCTEQPVIFEPFNMESLIAEPPLYAGSIDGWIFIILSAIDNLLKGQTGQAIQNLNIMSGYSIDEGLDLTNNFP